MVWDVSKGSSERNYLIRVYVESEDALISEEREVLFESGEFI